AWGNGGENITWNGAGGGHEAVVFGGKQNRQRHHNNIKNVKEALEELWSGDPHTIRDIDGGTTQDLKNAIAAACQNLDENTQLLLYFDDHGGTTFDIGEFLGWLMPRTISSYLNVVFSLHDGWKEAMQGMFNAGYTPTPTLNMTLSQPMDPTEWLFLFNGLPLALPPGPLSGLVQIAVSWWNIKAGDNKLELVPTGSPSQPIEVDGLEFDAGDVEDGEVIELLRAALLGHWKLDGFKDGGTKVHDASGNGHDGTIYGAPALVEGVSGGALLLDGVDDHIVVGPVDISGADPRTIAGWGKADIISMTGRSTVLGFTGATGGANEDFCVKADPGAGQWLFRFGDQEENFIPLDDSEWHHFVATYDGTRVNWYADGVPTGTLTGVTLDTSDNFGIGRSVANPNSFAGQVDEVAIFDRALTREEIGPLANPPLDLGEGGVGLEVFRGIQGTDVVDLTNDPRFPDNPDWLTTMHTFESPVNLDDNFGARLSGWLTPPDSGDYHFFVSSNDGSQVWLSSDHDPGNAIKIAEVPGWTSPEQWDKYAEQKSAAIPLEGGQLYFIQALFKEGGGGDFVQVGWERPGMVGPTIIDGQYLIPNLPANGLPLEWFSFNDTTFDPSNPASVLENPLFSVELPNIDQDYGWGSQSAYVPEDNVAAQGAANLDVPADGDYTFYLTADDGAMLWIDGQLVIDTRTSPPGTEVASNPIPLVAGQPVSIEIRWYDIDGSASVHLYWEAPALGIAKEIVPRTAFFPPDHPYFISPPDGAVNVDHQPVVTWVPGTGTKGSQVRFGTDPANLPLVAIKALGDESYNPGTLELGETCHVQIDGINWDDTITPGQVWKFTVADHITLDNMEGYDDDATRIFFTWWDGQGTEDTLGNFTGSEVGRDHIFVHGGLWSMSLNYDNTGQRSFFPYSQADKQFDPPLDLSDIAMLTAQFRGSPPPGDYDYSERSDTHTLWGSGADIWGNSDEFHYGYQQMTGDSAISAQVFQIEPGNAWTKAGVMMRETQAPGSRNAGIYITPGHG
ncbi:MAG: hypothetical protein JSW47_15070, partial [Phycisphaerales bacterium]